MQSAIFSSEDRQFMDAVNLDLDLFIKGNNLISIKAVLVFPPFNNFRRFLVHKVVEDTYNSAGLSTFSIGQDFQRRIIVCHSALKLRLKSLQETTLIHSIADKDNKPRSRTEMIEKDIPKPRATANIYRPPAARLPPASASDSKLEHDYRLKENRRSRVRRPDLQVYVPRPKRASYGDIEKSRSPPSSVDKAMSFRRKNDCLQERRMSLGNSAPKVSISDAVDLTEDDSMSSTECNILSEQCDMSLDERMIIDKYSSRQSNTKILVKSDDRVPIVMMESSPIVVKLPDLFNSNNLENPALVVDENKLSICESPGTSVEINSLVLMKDKPVETLPVLLSCEKTNVDDSLERQLPKLVSSSCVNHKPSVQKDICSSNIDSFAVKGKHELSSDKSKNISVSEESSVHHEEIEDTLTLSDENQTATSSDDVISISSTITESSSDDSLDSSESSSSKRKPIKKKKQDNYSTDSSESNSKILMHERTNARKDDEKNLNPEERNLKNRRILHGKPSSDILIISDPVEPLSKPHNNLSKQDNSNTTAEKPQQNIKRLKEKPKSSIKSVDKHSSYNPDDYEWDSLFTDDGECLVPEFMEELTKSVGRVKITTAKSDYRQFQTEEERSGDGECIIEIYDFPAEFKTNDLLNIFAAYRNRGFHIKWVDDTHALGVFGSPVVADEILATNLPFVKTRPLRQAIAESRVKARSLVLPPMERPKTCPALARRLVTGALGLRLPTASKEREAEKLVLKEAREKRRLEVKQREAAWEGTFN